MSGAFSVDPLDQHTKLIDIVLPQWVDGYKNWNGEEWPGFGLEGDGPKGAIVQKMDDSRNRFFLIKNQYGGWSKVFMLSLQHGEQIDTKIRTIEFTAYFYDELTQVDHEDYFIKRLHLFLLGSISLLCFKKTKLPK